MKRKIIHLSLIREFKDNSVFSGTLCGREQWQGGAGEDGGGNNCTENHDEVTCKLCLNQMCNRKLISDKEYIERRAKQNE